MATINAYPTEYSRGGDQILQIESPSYAYALASAADTTFARISPPMWGAIVCQNAWIAFSGFNFNAIPDNAEIKTVTGKIKSYNDGVSSGERYFIAIKIGTKTGPEIEMPTTDRNGVISNLVAPVGTFSVADIRAAQIVIRMQDTNIYGAAQAYVWGMTLTVSYEVSTMYAVINGKLVPVAVKIVRNGALVDARPNAVIGGVLKS